MKSLIYLFILLSTIGCTGQTTPSAPPPIEPVQHEIEAVSIPKLDSPKPQIQNLQQLSTVESSVSYKTVKQTIERQRQQLQAAQLPLDSVGQLFENALVSQIIPFWEGTEWSFEGHTSQPQSGEIACGYFVSTTLQHMGLNLNRYKLAQQSPINEAKSLALNMEVKEIAEASVAANIPAIKQYLKEGIHFIGFDTGHVGYILKRNGALYLIHSNYVGAVGVEIEPIETSDVFDSYDRYHIVPLSTIEQLLRYWMNQQAITIIQQ